MRIMCFSYRFGFFQIKGNALIQTPKSKVVIVYSCPASDVACSEYDSMILGDWLRNQRIIIYDCDPVCFFLSETQIQNMQEWTAGHADEI